MEFNGTFFAAIISFLVFVFLMNKVLYEPIQKIMKERDALVNSNYSEAENNNKKAEELLEEHDAKIVDAREDARTKYNEILDEYKEQRADIVSNAQSAAKDDLEQAYASLQNVSEDAKQKLKWHIGGLANDIIEKVLGYRSDIQELDNDTVDKILYK